jgi:hypothetical protein
MAIQVELEYRDYLEKAMKNKAKARIDWNNEHHKTLYRIRLVENFRNIDITGLTNVGYKASRAKSIISKSINEMHHTIRKSVNETSECLTKSSKLSRHVKKRAWWDPELEHAKGQVNIIYAAYKTTSYNDARLRSDLREAKQMFRKLLRSKKRRNQNSITLKLENLFKKKRTEFWRQMKSATRKGSNITIPVDQIQEEYIRLFNDKIMQNNDNQDDTIENKLKEYIETIANENRKIKIDQNELNDFINSLGNGKATGFAEVSNEMWK